MKFRNILAILALTLLLSGCATSKIITKASQLESKEGTGIVVAGFNFHIPDSRMERYELLCKNMASGEDVICFKGYNNTRTKAKGAYRITSGAYRADIGKYELNGINLHIRIGTRTYKGRKKPIYDEHRFELNKPHNFEISEGVNYLGRFEVFLGFDAFYKLRLKKVAVANARTQDADMLPQQLRADLGKSVKTSFPLLEDTEMAFSITQKVGAWNTVIYEKDLCKLEVPIIFRLTTLSADRQMYVEDNILNIKNSNQGFPVFPSTGFSTRIKCTLGKYMSEKGFTEFRQTGKYWKKKNVDILTKWKYHYMFPVEFR